MFPIFVPTPMPSGPLPPIGPKALLILVLISVLAVGGIFGFMNGAFPIFGHAECAPTKRLEYVVPTVIAGCYIGKWLGEPLKGDGK